MYRQDLNFVTGDEFETVDYHMIVQEIIALDKQMKALIERMGELSISDVIK